MPTVVVVVNDRARLPTQHYFISLLLPAWQALGIDVTVVEGPDADVPADVALLHVDLTHVPDAYLALAQRHPRAMNFGAADISKRTVSRRLVQPGDGYAGPVIVKTDANCGGLPDRFAGYRTPVLGQWRRAWDRFGPSSRTGIVRYGEYAVLDSADDVPSAIWGNRAFVVEQFSPERDGPGFALRTWTFLGDREINRRSVGPDPVVKRDNTTQTTDTDPAPDEVRAFRQRIGLDYGKIDYVISDGVPVVLDANRTPTYSPSIGARGASFAAGLASGIDAWLP